MAKAVAMINDELGPRIYYKVDKTNGADELYQEGTINNIDKIDKIPADTATIIGATAFGFARELLEAL